MIMMSEKLRGTGVAIITPFKNDLSIDINTIEKLVNFLIENGVNYLVVQGTTGETSTLTYDEKIISRKAFVKANNGRVPLVLGMGSNNTSEIVHDLKNSDYSDFCAILSVTPYYNKPSQEGLYNHYSLISKSTNLPIILYNVPSRTGVNLLPETTINLSNNHENIIGIKEASGDLNQIKKLINNRPENFLIISGDDDTAPQTALLGGDGVISVTAGCIPKKFVRIIKSAMSNNEKLCLEEFNQIKGLISLLFQEGNPSGIKSALNAIGLCDNNLRLPLTKVSRELELKIKSLVFDINKK